MIYEKALGQVEKALKNEVIWCVSHVSDANSMRFNEILTERMRKEVKDLSVYFSLQLKGKRIITIYSIKPFTTNNDLKNICEEDTEIIINKLAKAKIIKVSFEEMEKRNIFVKSLGEKYSSVKVFYKWGEEKSIILFSPSYWETMQNSISIC